ncbi:carbohydrate ABC transporter permease [Terracoccus luteus]|uniref:Multiple sugar transport system permease protein n=1 Tax=Terracoccus luteus TaxID=53356 RepID=A0A839PR97_9MICO|nr:sugar ABC transporter permease [Terracoccus luteus]MBB2986798.1 multiple sugar transport system permease protein [Terracoccus luteus]MCP2172449.1 multiple sugar transport system permease protein [Terracoccus luteus]
MMRLRLTDRRGSALQRREARAGYLFISPWVFGFLALTAGPMVVSLYLSFTDYSLVNETHQVGLENYRQLFEDPRVGKSLANTFVYAAMFVPLGIVVALGLALLLLRLGRFSGFFRTVFYLPVMTPGVAAGAMFLLLLNGQRGLLNDVLGWFGITGPNWTTDPAWLKPSLAVVSLWTMGGSIIIYLAALNNVPKQLYEAALLDGAGPVRRFVSVTLPMISGALFFTVITHTIGAMQMFDQAFTMYYGPQQGATASDESLVYMVYLFQNAFQYFRMGFASALAWVLFAIILVITVVQVRVGNRFVHYEGGSTR